MYYLMLFYIFFTVMTVYVLWRLYVYFKKRYIFAKAQNTLFPESYRKILQNIVYYRHLPNGIKDRVEKKILLFIATKEFVGVKITVSDEMRVVIAFFASLMVVNIKGEYYEELETILIYPHEMVMNDIVVNNGIYSQERLVLQGQSIGSVIVIAWDDAKKEAYHLRHNNVIIHELAHVLDFEEGSANGVPNLERSKYDSWSRVLYSRFKELNEMVKNASEMKEYALIGEYASTNEAEFFAVLSEIFFQNPKALKQSFPDLYDEFSIYYRLDPAEFM